MNLGRMLVPKPAPRRNSLGRMDAEALAVDIDHEGLSLSGVLGHAHVKGALIFGQWWQIGAIDRRRVRANQRAAFGVVLGAGVSHGLEINQNALVKA